VRRKENKTDAPCVTLSGSLLTVAIRDRIKVKGKIVPKQTTSGEEATAEVYLYSFLTSTLDAGEWSVSRPDRFIPGEITPVTEHETGCATDAV
jgi:hypothetical protein